MTIDMNDDAVTSIAQLLTFVNTAETLGVECVKRKDDKNTVYAWINDLLIRLRYRFLGKKDKGLVRRYRTLYSGYTKTHVDHLIGVYKEKRGQAPLFIS